MYTCISYYTFNLGMFTLAKMGETCDNAQEIKKNKKYIHLDC